MAGRIKIYAVAIPSLLVLCAFGTWYGVDLLVARQLPLVQLVEIGELEGIEYVTRWDPQQINTHQEVTVLKSNRRISSSPYLSRCETTPLMHAIAIGRHKSIELFLSTGMDVNDENVSCVPTLLHYAAYCGDGKTVRLLIDAGAQTTATDQHKLTPMDYASIAGNEEAIRALREAGATGTYFVFR